MVKTTSNYKPTFFLDQPLILDRLIESIKKYLKKDNKPPGKSKDHKQDDDKKGKPSGGSLPFLCTAKAFSAHSAPFKKQFPDKVPIEDIPFLGVVPNNRKWRMRLMREERFFDKYRESGGSDAHWSFYFFKNVILVIFNVILVTYLYLLIKSRFFKKREPKDD